VSRRPLRVLVPKNLLRSSREAGFDSYVLPETVSVDFNRSLGQRLEDGPIVREFLEKHDIELLLDSNTAGLTLLPSSEEPGTVSLTNHVMGIPHVACYVDLVTSTMAQVGWSDHWHLLENPGWIKAIFEIAHGEELHRLGVPHLVSMPCAMVADDFDTSPPPEDYDGPPVAFIGHPATSWFHSNVPASPAALFPGMIASAVRADMPDMLFHKIYYDLYEFAEPPKTTDDRATRAKKSSDYFSQKFFFHAFLAVKQRDRFVRFLKAKLGDSFELIGDHWGTHYGLKHTPRIWDMKVVHQKMRCVPICLNMVKGCAETGLNLRHFEITAHGGFMLAYPSPELGNFFEIGKECDIFRDEQELLEKISYYLANPAHRREIAAAGQRRTLSEHLYPHRLTNLVKMLRQGGALPKTAVKADLPTTATTTDLEPEGSTSLPKMEVSR